MIKNFQELVSQIKTQIPIQELIAEFISVKRAGKNFVAICPFHNDHHPSMHISPQKGIFKCFVCGTGGDLITFYSSIKKLKWADAIPELATKYGLKIEYEDEDSTENKIKNQLYELNKIALEFFKKSLFNYSEAFSYLTEKRNLTLDTIKKYELGYAPNKWDGLLDYFIKEKNYTNELIIASGLFASKENQNGFYDRFRNRIMFPIFNESNNIVGFGGRRLLDNNDEAKYINSPETLVFNKGNLLYGLNFAKDEIRKLDSVVLTEGYLDVITAHQYGLINTVATLGTALSVTQIRLLTKYTNSKKVYLCLDTDLAGKKAVLNISNIFREPSHNLSCDFRVVSSLPSKDLDESLKIETPDKFRKRFEEAEKLNDFILKELGNNYLSKTTDIDKNESFNQIIEVITSIKDPIEQKESIKHTSHNLNIDEELLNIKAKNKLLYAGRRYKKSRIQDTDTISENYKMHSTERFKHAELELLTLYVSSFPHSQSMKQELINIEFVDEKNKLINDFIDNLKTEDSLSPQDVINQLILEFNEYKNIMSLISDIAWRIETDNQSLLKNKNLILHEAKEWINWWINNKQKMKSYTELLKDCKGRDQETEILTKMMELVKKEDSKNKKKKK